MWSKPPRKKTTALTHNEEECFFGDTQPSHRLWAQPARQLRLLRDLCSDLPEWIRWHRHGTVVLVRCGTRRMSSLEKRHLHNCSLRNKKNQRTWDKLVILMKKVCYQLSLFSQRQVQRDPCSNQVQICLKNGNQVATWKTSKLGLSLKGKKSKILAEVRTEIQKHEFQAESDRRSIQESTGIIESQRMEIDHTITRGEQSRRDHLLLK